MSSHAVALAADHQLLDLALRGRGQAGQDARRRIGVDVVDRDEVGGPLLELLLDRLGRIADDEHLVVLVADAPADLAPLGG